MDKKYLYTSNIPSLRQVTGINKQLYVPNSSYRNFVVWQELGVNHALNLEQLWGGLDSKCFTPHNYQLCLIDVEFQPR